MFEIAFENMVIELRRFLHTLFILWPSDVDGGAGHGYGAFVCDDLVFESFGGFETEGDTEGSGVAVGKLLNGLHCVEGGEVGLDGGGEGRDTGDVFVGCGEEVAHCCDVVHAGFEKETALIFGVLAPIMVKGKHQPG